MAKSDSAYGASSISTAEQYARKRRTRSDIGELCGAIHHVASQLRPMTVRQVFYQLVKLRLIEKPEREYNDVVVRLLAQLRLEGDLPWEWIADSTRWMRRHRRCAARHRHHLSTRPLA